MTQTAPSPESVLRTYFHAKDENRPHLLDEVFAEDAVLHVHNASSAITFPSVTHGREAISAVLVGDFNRAYENIYSFYLARPPADAAAFACAWLVGMTDKSTREVRVGCGTYEWQFGAAPTPLASQLVIRIDAMQLLPSDARRPVLSWLRSLSYPWSSPAEMLNHAPAVPGLAPVLQWLHGRKTVA